MDEVNELARAHLTEGEIRRHYGPKQLLSNSHSNGKNPHKNHHIRSLREERGLSQGELADRIGITKESLRSLETKSWENLSLKELELLAPALGMSSEEILCHIKFRNAESYPSGARLSEKDPFFVCEILEGIRIEAYVRRPREFFIGTLIIPPQKTLLSNQSPQADFIFYGVLKGELLLTLPEKKYVLKPGSRISLHGGIPV